MCSQVAVGHYFAKHGCPLNEVNHCQANPPPSFIQYFYFPTFKPKLQLMTQPLPLRTRRMLHLIALLSLGAVGVALISQHVFDMAPCAWCVFQRLIYIGIAVVCWLGLALGQARAALGRIAAGCATLLAAGGMVAAWYQYKVAAQMFSCAQTFADRFMVQSGLDAGLPWLFGIYATCMDARVDLLGIEYALWSLALFALLAGAGAWAALRGRTPL